MYEPSRSLEADVAAIRATVERLAVEQEHLRGDVRDLRQELRSDITRLDGRIFQLQLAILATLAGTIGSIVASVVS